MLKCQGKGNSSLCENFVAIEGKFVEAGPKNSPLAWISWYVQEDLNVETKIIPSCSFLLTPQYKNITIHKLLSLKCKALNRFWFAAHTVTSFTPHFIDFHFPAFNLFVFPLINFNKLLFIASTQHLSLLRH